MPHFFRFVTYAIASMTYLEYFLAQRGLILWTKRNLPSVCFLSLVNASPIDTSSIWAHHFSNWLIYLP